MKTTKSYIICAAARTGSNLLATGLRQLGTVGTPNEYVHMFKEHRQGRLDLGRQEPFTDLVDWFEYALENRCTENGVFGVTVHWWHMEALLPALAARGLPGIAPTDRSVRTFQAFFPNLSFIFLRRQNKVAQAISHYRAEQSNIWQVIAKHKPEKPTPETPYNYEDIDRLVKDAERSDTAWREFLKPVRDRTLELTYEDLNGDYENAMRRVLRFLDMPSFGPIAPSRLTKQGDTQSLELERRYVEERKARAAQDAPKASVPAPSPEPEKTQMIAKRRVCFVTTEFHGLFRNGGIGTANTSLALALADAGHAVTVIFANADQNGPKVSEGNFDELKEHYAERGITLDYPPPEPYAGLGDARLISYNVYRYLRRHEFDVVFFNDCGGQGYYTLLAKHTGAYPNPPVMCMVSHGPLEWVHELNAVSYSGRASIVTAHIERRCVELADIAISPSQYLLDWMIARGWTVPANMRVLQNIVQVDNPVDPDRAPSLNKVKEIVFFGRLEVRKGLELFCDAIDLLEKEIDMKGLQVTFMGKFDKVASLHSGVYLLERSRRWRAFTRFIVTYDQQHGLEYLQRDGVLAVIPSVAENSPCVVSECLQLGVSFLATKTGGTPELVAPEDREHCLFEPLPGKLMVKLRNAVQSGQRSARMAISPAKTAEDWQELVAHQPVANEAASGNEPKNAAAAGNQPLLSVCFVSSGQNAATRACLDSILNQNDVSAEIIVVQNGAKGAKFAPQETGIPCRHLVLDGVPDHAAARNAAAVQAKGKYLLFVDELNVVLAPDCLSIFVAAAEKADADVITGIALQFTGDNASGSDGKIAYLPIGACPELGAFENCYGGGAILVHRKKFLEQTGFKNTGDPQFEDWLFLAEAALSNMRMEVVPQPLFWQRAQPAAEMNRPDRVLQHRHLLDVYNQRPFADFRKITEMLLDVNQKNNSRLNQILAPFGSEAAEIAATLSNGIRLTETEVRQKFFQYCLARHRIREALDFVLVNDPAMLPSAFDTAETAARLSAGEIAQSHLPEFVHRETLNASIKEKIRAVSSLTAADLKPIDNGIISHPLALNPTVVKAANVCPPGAKALHIEATSDGPGAVQFAAALTSPFGRVVLGEDGSAKGDVAAWSGWVTAKDQSVVLTLNISEPATQALDLFLLSRTADGGAVPEGTATWRSVTADISVGEAMTPSSLEIESRAMPMDERMRASGVVLADLSDVSFPIYRPGLKMLLHPVAGRSNLTRFANALTPGAKGVRCAFSVADERAHDVEFGIWLKDSAMPAADESGLANAVFSGWIRVRDRMKRHQVTLTLPQPGDGQDLYLATRVPDQTNAWHCHALWHEIFILE